MNKIKATLAASTLVVSFLVGAFGVSAQVNTVTPTATSKLTITPTPKSSITSPTPTTTIPGGAPKTGQGL